MIGKTNTGLALLYPIDPDGLSDYRLDRIDDMVHAYIEAQLQISQNLAISGAMRWPYSFRPEAVVDTKVSIA